MADIFVSYASEDRARIQPLVAELEAAGFSVWWDRQLKGGTRFSAEIEQELKRARVVLVAWSPNAIESRWVADEADLALETGNLLPISLDGARSPLGFRQLQTIDFSGWDGGMAACVSDLLSALEHHLQAQVQNPDQPVTLPASSSTRSDASIAVLPFVNMSDDPDYFSDGVSEELLNLLARIKELTVIARTSSFTFKGSDKPIAEIGKLLDVAFILEGSVRKAGNRVRITAQLIETGKSSHLWSQTYDRTLDDIFAVQDEISAAIVKELKAHILGGETMQAPMAARSASVGAYEHYILGQQFLATRTQESITTGKQHFEDAIAADPDYAPALVGLADAHLLLSDHMSAYGRTPLQRARKEAIILLSRALELDAEAPEVHGVLSLYHLLGDDSKQAEAAAEKAIALNANYTRAYNLLAASLRLGGDPAAPIFSTIRKAVQLDPTSIVLLSDVAIQLGTRTRWADAEAIVRQLESLTDSREILVSLNQMLAVHRGDDKEVLGLLLEPDVAFKNTMSTYRALTVAASLGYVEPLERFDVATAISNYINWGDSESADRLASTLAKQDGVREDYEQALTLSEWEASRGNFAEALSYLTPFDEPDPDGWGRHYDSSFSWAGALRSLYLKLKLGKRAGAVLILEKLKYVVEVNRADPDGAYYATDFLEACIAMAEGDPDRAISALENQVARSWFNAIAIVVDLAFTELHGNPRFEALREKVIAHFAAERKKAEDAGLLPIPEELLARLK